MIMENFMNDNAFCQLRLIAICLVLQINLILFLKDNLQKSFRLYCVSRCFKSMAWYDLYSCFLSRLWSKNFSFKLKDSSSFFVSRNISGLVSLQSVASLLMLVLFAEGKME